MFVAIFFLFVHCNDRPEEMKIYARLSLVIGIFLIVILASSALKRPGKVIIDTDAGGDDAGAILHALAIEEKLKNDGFEVIAITCTYGNTVVTNVEQNVLKILTIAGRSDIPVYGGVHRPLLRNYTMDNFFGEDGLGDIDFNEEVIGKIDRSKHASVAMVDLARKHSGNISIIALGPLTNIAIAISLDPSFVNNVERFYVMGSSVRGFGNTAPNVEFNFSQDPPSNFVVLNSTRGLPLILLPWETCVGAKISMDWRIKVLGAIDSRAINFLNKVDGNSSSDPLWPVADDLLIALILWPELITRSRLTNVTPVFDGAAQGSVLVDYANKTGKTKNVMILEDVDVEGFKEKLLYGFS